MFNTYRTSKYMMFQFYLNNFSIEIEIYSISYTIFLSKLSFLFPNDLFACF